MKHFFDLQLFDDGDGSDSGSQSGNAGNGNGSQANAGTQGGYSFQQAEEIAQARADRAERAALSSYFRQQGLSENEINEAIKDFKAKREQNKPNVDAITKERDEAREELAALKNTSTLRAKGVKDDDLDYVMFKVQAEMKADDKLDFKKALDKFLKENPRYASSGNGYRVSSGTGAGQGGQSGGNTSINDAIRRAARR